MLHETPYGVVKRLDFFRSVLNDLRPTTILEMGCGTGTQVATPLATMFPASTFLGVDCDLASIEYARKHNVRPNLTFCTDEDLDVTSTFDLVIASEVLEHVEDPASFLLSLKSRLTWKGRIVLTVPNGYGPFEVSTLTESIFFALGITRITGSITQLLRGRRSSYHHHNHTDTLANSPHVNFFHFNELRTLLLSAGLPILKYQGRTWLCGYGLDPLLTLFGLSTINAKVANYLPPCCVSDWMILVDSIPVMDSEPLRYTRNTYSRLRRRFNLRRCGLPFDSPEPQLLQSTR